MTRLSLLLLLVVLSSSSHVEAGNLSRTFPGGAATDHILSASALTSTTARSASAWVNVAAYTAGQGRLLSWRETGGANEEWEFLSNQWQMSITWTTGATWTMPGPTAGTRTHVAYTYDGSSTSNAPVMYLSGVSQTVTTSVAATGTLTTAARTMTIGGRFGGSGNEYNGSVDGLAFWNVVLSAGDIAKLAAGEPPCAVQPANLIAYYPFDNGKSPEPDFGPAHVNGTIVSGTTTTAHTPTLTNPQCESRMSLTGAGQ